MNFSQKLCLPKGEQVLRLHALIKVQAAAVLSCEFSQTLQEIWVLESEIGYV